LETFGGGLFGRFNLNSPFTEIATRLHKELEDFRNNGGAKTVPESRGDIFTETEKLQIEIEARKAITGKK